MQEILSEINRSSFCRSLFFPSRFLPVKEPAKKKTKSKKVSKKASFRRGSSRKHEPKSADGMDVPEVHGLQKKPCLNIFTNNLIQIKSLRKLLK